MSVITPALIQQLREKTGLGMMECKKYLTEAGGDFEKAFENVRKAGVKPSVVERAAKEGWIGSYIHHNGKVGVIVEVNCITDFVAKGADFQALIRDLALHIAASPIAPVAVKRESVPAEIVEKEKEIAKAQVPPGKPPAVIEKIIEGKLNTWFAERVLMEQPFVKDPTRKIQDLVNDLIKKTAENIVVARFARFDVGKS